MVRSGRGCRAEAKPWQRWAQNRVPPDAEPSGLAGPRVSETPETPAPTWEPSHSSPQPTWLWDGLEGQGEGPWGETQVLGQWLAGAASAPRQSQCYRKPFQPPPGHTCPPFLAPPPSPRTAQALSVSRHLSTGVRGLRLGPSSTLPHLTCTPTHSPSHSLQTTPATCPPAFGAEGSPWYPLPGPPRCL